MFAGCGLMVALTLVPYWSSLTPQAFLDVFGRFNILIPRTLEPILLPALISVLGSLILTWRVPQRRLFWLLSAGCFFATLALTALYFLPLNAAFAQQTLPLGECGNPPSVLG